MSRSGQGSVQTRMEGRTGRLPAFLVPAAAPIITHHASSHWRLATMEAVEKPASKLHSPTPSRGEPCRCNRQGLGPGPFGPQDGASAGTSKGAFYPDSRMRSESFASATRRGRRRLDGCSTGVLVGWSKIKMEMIGAALASGISAGGITEDTEPE